MVSDTFVPVQVLKGIYLGLVAGIVPALVAFAFGFLFKYVTGLTIPALGVVVLSVAIAGVNGGLMAFTTPEIVRSVTLITALTVVLMLSFYTHAQGDKLGAKLPKRISLRSLRERKLSADVVEFVGSRGQVTVSVVGDVADVEGYPPLPEDLRTKIREAEWSFPADLPLAELEQRFEDRLTSEFDVADAHVTIDERARATVQAAPPMSGVSKRVPAGKRAVSVDALVPTGLARGDTVTVLTPESAVSGTVVSAKSTIQKKEKKATTGAGTSGGGDGSSPGEPELRSDGGEVVEAPVTPRAPTTTGGEGRITVAVDRSDAEALLDAPEGRVVVTARGTRREYELVTLLRRAGQRLRRVTVGSGGPLDDVTIGETGVRETYGVVVLAVRHEGEWTMAPRGDTRIAAGDDLFVVGSREAGRAFEEAVV
ncbi:potassium channel family protein [Halospeciosus flavus]|uniref:Potassium channel family protein n=1 Tax=Halospeciosus flavus TaxID=3032283 RepID=A0ABD5Z8M0_9EURY|nr:TrkA C-terminal domain-containing protein [Halospeciosus flavus]